MQNEQHPKPTFTSRLWRLENLYFIKDKNGKVVKFKLKKSQRKLLDNLHTRNIILKARQLGMSTFIAILFLDECLFKPNTSAAIVADKIENGKNIFKKVEFAWDNLNTMLKEQLGIASNSDSTSEMSWTNGSSFKVGTTLHSGTYQCLHISEYGPLCNQSPEKAEDVKKSALPTVPSDGGLVFIESTAEGEGNDFHQLCIDAMDLQAKTKTENRALFPMEYRFHFFPWFEEEAYRVSGDVKIAPALTRYFDDLERRLSTPDRPLLIAKEQRNWYALTERELKGRMKEQHPSTPDEAFLASGNKQFNPEILERKMQTEVFDPVFVDGDLQIFVPYKRNHAYGVGADVSDGVGLDSSAAAVIDFTTNEVVATYKSNTIDPVNFAFDLARIGNMYGGAVIAPENNRTGHTTCVKLQEVYPNIYQFELLGYTEIKQTIRLGWSTTTSTKPRMMSELKAAFEDEEKPLKVPDATIIREARMYAKEDNMLTSVAQAAKTTRHFDLLTATAIAWQMRHHAHVSVVDPREVHHVNRLRAKAMSGERRFR